MKNSVSILLVTNTVIDLFQIALSFGDPRFQAELASGRVADFPLTSFTIVIFAFSLFMPLIMAFAVQVIKNPHLNKWLNFIIILIICLMSWFDFLGRSIDTIGLVNWLIALATNIPITIALYYAWQLDKVISPLPGLTKEKNLLG